MSLCLVAIFKNESHILDEYIKHYLNQGVDHFFFVDNGSDDAYLNILNKYKNITLKIDPTRPFQVEHYNNYYLKECKKYDWVIVCDLDEFIYSRRNFRTIKEYLNSLDNFTSQVFIPWKIFGSSGFKQQPENVVEHFTTRINYDKESKFQGVILENKEKYSLSKCIVRTKYLKQIGIHSHHTLNKNYIGADNQMHIHPNKNFYKINERILANSFLHLNHYAIQSYDWFMRIKATRGDVHSDYVRGESYFRDFDDCSNDVCDDELKLLNQL